jgi:tRNA (guanine-N7-)-methyltransferase
MRKKKNLSARLCECVNLIMPDVENKNFAADAGGELIDLAALFGNDRPVELEIGCGKGGFICEMARRRPDCNFLAVERSENVLVMACERAMREGLSNLRFLCVNAEYLPRFIAPDTVERIYLNFSCPFPKSSYASHRLTAPAFLQIYKRLMREGAEIHQKTDNHGLFEFSIEQFSSCGFALKNVSLDLHSSGFEDNIVTEYEQKFVSQGLPIYRLEAYIK